MLKNTPTRKKYTTAGCVVEINMNYVQSIHSIVAQITYLFHQSSVPLLFYHGTLIYQMVEKQNSTRLIFWCKHLVQDHKKYESQAVLNLNQK